MATPNDETGRYGVATMTKMGKPSQSPEELQVELLPAAQPIVPQLPVTFFPQHTIGPSLNYQKFAAVRQKLLLLIREQTPRKERLIKEVTDALLEGDKEPPKGLVSLGFALLGLAHKLKANREKRERFAAVTNSLLEIIHDPLLECKMRKKDVLDAFEANGIAREKVSSAQIRTIYVQVLHALKVGQLRDATWEEPLLLEYVRMKIDEITISRQQWEIEA